MASYYRPEIDGLRTLAVVSVIIYHLKIPFAGGYVLPGGFLGVDLFFVLSGFLITGILQKEIDATGRVSFFNFYARRLRRILPPLLLVILVSLPLAWFILLPSEVVRFGRSLFAALGFYSNFFWFFELGEYGAQSGLLQPFLHTWSLSIEEQFYLLFPVLLIVLARVKNGRWTDIALVLMLVASLIVAQLTTSIKPPLSFFSPASRAWELLAGSMLVFLARRNPELLRGGAIARIAPPVLLLILLVCFATVSLEEAAHPGIATIPVVLATCGLIWFARPQEPVTRLLSTAPFVTIGKLSYSLYLWHYPIFAFGRLSSLESPSLGAMAAWVAVTVACSWLSYRLVEVPFRFRVSTRGFAVAMTAALAVIGAFSVTVIAGKGFPGRFASILARYGANDFDTEALADKSMSILDKLATHEDIGRWNAGKQSQHELHDLWFSPQAQTRVLVVGNSHSKDMFNALYLHRHEMPGTEFARIAMSADFEERHVRSMMGSPNFKAANVILIAPKYRVSAINVLRDLIPTMKRMGKRVILVGNSAEFVSPSTMSVFDWYMWRHEGQPDFDEINRLGYRYEAHEAHYYTRMVQDLARANNVAFRDRRGLLCDDTARRCRLVTPAGRRTMYDDNHWTLEGADFFGAEVVRQRWLRPEG